MRDRSRIELGDTATPDMLERALKGEPIAYIKGVASFCGLEFNVTSDVMIPRVASEVLIDSCFDELVKKHKLLLLYEKNFNLLC